MRVFVFTTLATLLLGLGAAAALGESDEAASEPLLPMAAPERGNASSDVKAVTDGKFVSRDLAFDRLVLEAELEEFYAELRQQAEGLTEEERLALYREAEAELLRMILGSPTYSGQNLSLGIEYAKLARLVLARSLGLEEVPA